MSLNTPIVKYVWKPEKEGEYVSNLLNLSNELENATEVMCSDCQLAIQTFSDVILKSAECMKRTITSSKPNPDWFNNTCWHLNISDVFTLINLESIKTHHPVTYTFHQEMSTRLRVEMQNVNMSELSVSLTNPRLFWRLMST